VVETRAFLIAGTERVSSGSPPAKYRTLIIS
jgi:hypothetical protein